MDVIDISRFVEGDILEEQSFVKRVNEHDWSQYTGKKVLVRGCSDIIIPTWAYMMITGKLAGVADKIRYGNEHSNLVVYRRDS